MAKSIVRHRTNRQERAKLLTDNASHSAQKSFPHFLHRYLPVGLMPPSSTDGPPPGFSWRDAIVGSGGKGRAQAWQSGSSL